MNKKLTTTLLSATILAGGVIGAGSLVAAGDDVIEPISGVEAEEAAPSGLQTVDPTDDDTATDAAADDGDERRRRGCGGSEEVAEVLGLTTDELSAAREDGSSIADIAAAQGVDVDAVVQAMIDDRAERLEAKVADGEITAEEAQERLAGATERAEERVNRTPGS